MTDRNFLLKLFVLMTLVVLNSAIGSSRCLAETAEPVKTEIQKQETPKAEDSTVKDAAPNADAPITDKWALVVGIGKFKNSTLDLKFPSKDAKDFKDYLVKEANFAPDHVHLLTDEAATKEKILSEFGDKWLPRVARPDDLVLLYFSTHGSPSALDIRGVNYLVAYDTDPESLFSTGLAMRELVDAIKERIHSRRVVLILDACHSGGAANESKGLTRQSNFDADAVAQGTGQLVICSSQPQEVTWESKNYQNGVFTRHLIEGLRENDGNVSLAEAFKFVQKRVQEEVQRDRGVLQTPVLKSKWSGHELVLATQALDPRPGLEQDSSYASESQQSSTEPPITEQPKSSGTATSSKTEETSVVGIEGKWDSNWGPVTFEHEPITGDAPVEITGHWAQTPKKIGVFKSGTYDPVKRTVAVSYYQNWNFLHGSAKFKLNKSGNRMVGSFRQALILGGTWILWR